MEEGRKQVLQEGDQFINSQHQNDQRHDQSMIMEVETGALSSESLTLDSAFSMESISSSELVDDATSSTSSYSSSLLDSNGPLFELSELMAQLPIKRGLSKYYQGKSQSFTSLSRVRSIEDLIKKETPYNRRMKACSNSYGVGKDKHRKYTLPKTTICKKAPKFSLLSLSSLSGLER